MKKKTGSFMATGDDGRQYTVHIYTDYIDAGNFQDPKRVIAGQTELRTSDGMAVTRLQKGEYEIQTGVILRSSSHDAP